MISRFFEYPRDFFGHVTYSCLSVTAVVGLDNSTWEKNGVHIRGLLLYAGTTADGGAYLLRYLACKYFD